MGVVADPFGETEVKILAPVSGIVIGRTNLPLVNEGDALYHIARFEHAHDVATKVEEFHEQHLPEIDPAPTFEGPII